MKNGLFDCTVSGGTFNFDCAGKNDASQNVKLPSEVKEWVSDIATAVSETTGDVKYGASSVVREAILFYRLFYQHRTKLHRYRAAILSMISNLP